MAMHPLCLFFPKKSLFSGPKHPNNRRGVRNLPNNEKATSFECRKRELPPAWLGAWNPGIPSNMPSQTIPLIRNYLRDNLRSKSTPDGESRSMVFFTPRPQVRWNFSGPGAMINRQPRREGVMQARVCVA